MGLVERKLSLENLRTGMVLAEDIYDSDHRLIAPKNIPLDIETLITLKTYFVEREDKEILQGSIPFLPEDQRRTYISFKNSYLKSYDKIREYINVIQTGELADPKQVIKVTDEIMENVKLKSDVFTYLGYLQVREDFVYDHSICVSLVCRIFAEWLGFNETETEDLVLAGLLHDIGMLKVSDAIIKKEEKLSEEEFVKVKMHPIHGYNLVKDLDISDDVKYGILQHHERVDGTGYPNRLTDRQINPVAKVIAILDVFGAMIYDRPYRERFAPFTVIKTFERDYLGKLDTEYLMVFLANIAYNYIDRKVRLTNGKLGTIVFINKAQCSAPIIKLDSGEYIDLLFDKSTEIAEVL